jgi:hypothetical protein
MTKKEELLSILKGAKPKKEKKAFTVRFEPDLFETIEDISGKSDTPINTVILALIELGLAEYKKSL